MEKFKKPNFWNDFSQIGSFLFAIASNCITIINFPEKWNFWQKILFIIGISLSSWLVFMILYNVVYTIQLKKYCNEIEEKNKELLKNNNGLNNDNQKIKTDYNNLYKDFEYSLLLGNAILEDLKTGITSRIDGETDFLEQLYKIIDIKQEVRKKLKGDNKYERK